MSTWHPTNLKIINWNKINSLARNRIPTIAHILSTKKTDSLCIQETNIIHEEDINIFQMEGYELILDSMIEINWHAHTANYINEEIHYTHRTDLETKGEPVIWLTISPQNQKPFNLQNLYRQWQVFTSTHSIPNTDTIPAQKLRLLKIIQKWQIAIAEQETITMSDINLDMDNNWQRI